MSELIISLAVLKAKNGKRQILEQELLKLINPTRTEPGCLDYVLFGDVEDENLFYMREAFLDRQAFDLHIASPHFQAFAAVKDELLEEPLRLIALKQLSS